ncbi:anacyclamide/piricyclamide family prenylated cyclic peptide [Streptosporangium sp. NPDC051022]|uniref:anacyclamide/piricyclamide family prenylated cyclic peptide n=1 Tax=Streptosporangium sp. NPDC051022 TaxID=3155752 RepID=UPI00341E5BBB
MNTSRTMPHQSAPVERTITGTAASATVGVVPSFLTFKPLVSGFPFAGDDDN